MICCNSLISILFIPCWLVFIFCYPFLFVEFILFFILFCFDSLSLVCISWLVNGFFYFFLFFFVFFLSFLFILFSGVLVGYFLIKLISFSYTDDKFKLYKVFLMFLVE